MMQPTPRASEEPPRVRKGTAAASAAVRLDDAYLPLKSLVGYSGLSLRTLRGYLSHPSRPLPHYRVGAKVLVKRSEYDDWMATFRETCADRVGDIVEDLLGGV
jgi:hypothetical protein